MNLRCDAPGYGKNNLQVLWRLPNLAARATERMVRQEGLHQVTAAHAATPDDSPSEPPGFIRGEIQNLCALVSFCVLQGE